MLVQPGLFSALPEQFVVYVARHATPDRSRYDIPYNLPPGPELTERGRQEAAELGVYLRKVGVLKLWTSPFHRALSTAVIASTFNVVQSVDASVAGTASIYRAPTVAIPGDAASIGMEIAADAAGAEVAAAEVAAAELAEAEAAEAETSASETAGAETAAGTVMTEAAGISPIDLAPVGATLTVDDTAFIPVETDPDLCEWRPSETEAEVLERIERGFIRAARVSAQEGPMAIVSHGAPVLTLLKHLGLPAEVIERSRVFDSRNLIPMAGAWRVERLDGVTHLHLAFAPSGIQVPEAVPSLLL